MFEQNKTVIVGCAGNGFVVRLATKFQELIPESGGMLVFQTMEELVTFMQNHFTHRAEFVKTDLCGKLDD